jgi:hypothetical protein
MPGNLWDLGTPHTKQITNGITIDLMTEPDLAFFLYYKCPHVRKGQWKVDDPKAEIRAKADEKRKNLERETAIWQTLQDEAQLRKVSMGYGIEKAMTKEPDALRFELDALLKVNDEKQKIDHTIRGTKEFLEDLRINDYMRLSAFVRHWLDEGVINYRPDGRYRVGEKIIAHVPVDSVNERFKWLCNYFAAPNNLEELKSLFHDVVNREYLDKIDADKDYRWLAKVMELPGAHNKPIEQVKNMLYEALAV